MKWGKLLVIAVLLALLVVVYQQQWHLYLSLDQLKAQQQQLAQWHNQHFVALFVGYLLVYIAVTALSIPGAVILTLGSGALFGLGWGLLLASFASTLGAFLAFLSARYVLRDSLEKRFGERLQQVNAGIDRDGAWYLLTLRLVPLFPFWMINLVMGLTRMPAWRFYWVSQLGMLAGTAVFVNAGTQLAQVEQVSDILSGQLLLSFVLLGLFPLLAKQIVAWLKARRVYKGWQRPRQFDDNLLVIGAGSGGLVSAYIAAAVKAKVTLVEQHAMGGDCLNTGCVPSKALLHIAHGRKQANALNQHGVAVTVGAVDFKAVMATVQQVITAIEPHDSVERYSSLGVNVILGKARLLSPWQVEIINADGQVTQRSARTIILATGARPLLPAIPGLAESNWVSSDTIWQLAELPQRLTVLGGGPIGVELAQAFARLGSQVTVVEALPQLLPREDDDAAELVQQQLQHDGVTVYTGHKAVKVTQHNGTQQVHIVAADQAPLTVAADIILVALGRQPRLDGYGLQELGVETNKTITTNEFLQTNFPNIYAVGDVAGPFQLTHAASHQAWYAAVNALFSPLKKFKADYRVMPAATFCEPEVARVGLNEKEAAQQGIAVEVTRYDIDDLDRAIADQKRYGWVKVLTKPASDKILGVTIVGAQAGDLLAEFVLAMKHGIGLNKLLGTIHIYPTMAEANKYAAGVWKRAHAPQRVLAWLERFHGWRR
ncbi:FAD-dependent oxidoreductase [Pseudidiomarina mangrovi]|uniref:FAD-dependent oxidoreductase n=1 Tax=Pseudidiomarina mangrovi TaxID=2487133 RepID=UPI000FCC0216|nr:FAD-dependent oxidoreductase [Pseudidiomarina mangrovi]